MRQAIVVAGTYSTNIQYETNGIFPLVTKFHYYYCHYYIFFTFSCLIIALECGGVEYALSRFCSKVCARLTFALVSYTAL